MTYYEREMKLGFQLGLACGIPSILVSDGGQEAVCNLVTQCPLVRECYTGVFEKRFKRVTLFVNGEGEVGYIEKLGSRGDVLIEIIEQKGFCVLRLMSCA